MNSIHTLTRSQTFKTIATHCSVVSATFFSSPAPIGRSVAWLQRHLADYKGTVIMVTHELDIAAYCKRIIVMRDGKIIRDEPNASRLYAHDQRAVLDASEQHASLS